MLFKSNPLPCNSVTDSQFLPYYPVGMSSEKLLQIWNDVHSFQIAIFALNISDPFLAFFLAGGTSGGIIGSLTGLGAAGSAINSGFSGASGITRRSMVTPISVPFDQLADTKHPVPPVYWDDNPANIRQALSVNNIRSTVCGEYPYRSFSDGHGSVTIDFGRTAKLIQGDIFSPYIDIEFSNGVSSIRGAFLQGGVNFAGLGAVPIHGNEIAVVGGTILAKERYSDILMSAHSAKAGSSVRLGTIPPNTFSGFKNVTNVFIGTDEADFSYNARDKSITIRVPNSPQYNRILFIEKNGSLTNRFYSPNPLNITS